MARVADLSGNYATNAPTSGLDKLLSKPNRNYAGQPLGSLTPAYTGELVLNTTTEQIWIATGLTINDWTPVTKVI